MNHRPALYFTLRGLSEREASLFKSLVSIIDHRMRHQWICCETDADLLVLHDELHHAPAEYPMATLHVGTAPRTPSAGCGYLTLPLRANELGRCLDTLGNLLAARKARTSVGNGQAITAAPLLMRLRRWPPQHLLTGPQQVRMAALMTGQPMTFASLCQHSGLARETCASFVRRLNEAGLLQPMNAVPQAAPAAALPDAGVLARIRRRLGLLVGVRA